MACHVTKIYINKQPTKQKLNILVNKNLKALKTIDGTCTIPAISVKSRFAYAHVWSVCVITRSLLVAFARGCYAFINICCKIRKRHRKKINKIPAKVISISVSVKESYELSNSQKSKLIWSFLFWVVLCWDLSIISYFFWALLEVTILSIRRSSKQANKPKQNKTKIYKWASDENNTHAQ